MIIVEIIFNLDNQPQIVNIMSPPYDGETQSVASSIEVPVYNRAELLERYQVNKKQIITLKRLVLAVYLQYFIKF